MDVENNGQLPQAVFASAIVIPVVVVIVVVIAAILILWKLHTHKEGKCSNCECIFYENPWYLNPSKCLV